MFTRRGKVCILPLRSGILGGQTPSPIRLVPADRGPNGSREEHATSPQAAISSLTVYRSFLGDFLSKP